MKKTIFITIFVVFAILAFSTHVYAQTIEEQASELRAKSEEATSGIEKIINEIKILNNQKTKTVAEKNALDAKVKNLNSQKKALLKEKDQTQKKINALNVVIGSLRSEITINTNILNRSRESLAILLKNLYQQEDQPIFQKLLLKDNLADISREYNNLISISKQIKIRIEEVSIKKEVLVNSKTKKEKEQGVLAILKNILVKKQIGIEANKKEQDLLLQQKIKEGEEIKKDIADAEKRKVAFEKAIDDYEAQIKYILSPTLIPKPGSILSWPLISMDITSPFGERCLLKLYGACKFHNGIDLRAKVGTSVYAMSTGTVMGTGNTDIDCPNASFGNWVFIKYKNGLSSVYGHLSSISVNEGDNVKSGDIVGLSGGEKWVFGSGSSTGPHLHLGVYASSGIEVDTIPSNSCSGKIFKQPMLKAINARLNPVLYLPKI